MKGYSLLVMRIIYFFLWLITVTSCKDSEPTPTEFFSFDYKGKQYNLAKHKMPKNGGAMVESEQEWGAYPPSPNLGRIWINRTDIFGGVISFGGSGNGSTCTFFSSVDNVSDLYACGLRLPIDSVAVYFFKSGNHNATYENCVVKSGIDLWTGLNYTETICDVLGTFNLDLMNKENKIISITQGKYKFRIVK